MELSVGKADLQKELQLCQGVVEKRSTIPILSNVLLKAADGRLQIAATDLDTIVGPVRWGDAQVPPFAVKNIAKTPLVGGQWRLKEGGGYEIVITDNQTAPEIPAADTMQPIN